LTSPVKNGILKSSKRERINKMKTAMLIIFCLILLFDFFMMTPFGAKWTVKNLDDGKPCYGIIIMFITAIPLMLIGMYLGIIQ
jgi:hypothetical protein